MFDSIPLLAETAALMFAAYLGGCIVGYVLRRIVMAVTPRRVPVATAVAVTVAVQPTPQPAPQPEPRDEFASIARIKITPAQQLAATIEAERKAKADAIAAKLAEEERARVAVAAAVAAPPVAPPMSQPAEVAPAQRFHSTFGKPEALAVPRDGHKDNLKLIKGIGPRIEKGLNDLGIFHFDQIAAWDKKTVIWVETHFSFKGRIGREKWLAQAHDLAGSAARLRRSVKV